jgi:hypothetical protein
VKTLLGLGLMVLYAFSVLAWSNVGPSPCPHIEISGRHADRACMSHGPAPAQRRLPPSSAPGLVIR